MSAILCGITRGAGDWYIARVVSVVYSGYVTCKKTHVSENALQLAIRSRVLANQFRLIGELYPGHLIFCYVSLQSL